MQLCKARIPPERQCLQYFQRILRPWYGRKINVTRIVQQVDKNVASAYIILDRIVGVKPYGRTKPPARKPEEMVRDWLNKREVWRGYCRIDGRWYWIYWSLKAFNWSCKAGYERKVM